MLNYYEKCRVYIFSEVKLIFFKSFLSMDNIPLKIGEMGLDALNVYTQDSK